MKVWRIVLLTVILGGGLIGLIKLLAHHAGTVDLSFQSNSVVSGQLRSRGGPLGDYQITPRFCQTGSRDRFGGGILYAGSLQQGPQRQQGVVVVGYIDSGPDLGVRIMVPGRCRDPRDQYSCKRILLRARDCSRFEVETKSGKRLSRSGVYAFSGHARLTCALKDGAVVEADLSFDGCD